MSNNRHWVAKIGHALKASARGAAACAAGCMSLFGCSHGSGSEPAVYYGPAPVYDETPGAPSAPGESHGTALPEAPDGHKDDPPIGERKVDASQYNAEEIQRCGHLIEDAPNFEQCIAAYRSNRMMKPERVKAVYGPAPARIDRVKQAGASAANRYGDGEMQCCKDEGIAGSDPFESCVDAYRKTGLCGSDGAASGDGEAIAIYGMPDDFR